MSGWSDKSSGTVPPSISSQSQNKRKVSFHSSIGHHCKEDPSKEATFYDKNIQVTSNSKDFHQNGLLDNSMFLSCDPPTPCDPVDSPPVTCDTCSYNQHLTRQSQQQAAPSSKYQQRSARNSLLKVASILSFSQFLETSKETYL